MTKHNQAWQSIETAPTDGTNFFAYDDEGNPHLAEYCPEYCQFMGTQGEWIYPTHWMPLPEPPTEDEREQPWPKQSLPNRGLTAVLEWQPSWKHHHMPMWFKKAVRQRAINRGEWKPGISWAGDHLPSIFDHWGSFSPDLGDIAVMPSRKVAAMPYNYNDDGARAFASEIGCNVECLPQAPWHPATHLYIFSDNQTEPPTENARCPVSGEAD